MTIHYGNATAEQRRAMETRINGAIYLQSMLVDALQSTEVGEAMGYDMDNWRNLYRDACPECGDTDLTEYALDTRDRTEYECDGCGWSGGRDECNTTPQEVYEWYLLLDGSYLAERLEAAGEVVFEADGGWYWGRTCTGQAVVLDPTFWDIWQEWISTI